MAGITPHKDIPIDIGGWTCFPHINKKGHHDFSGAIPLYTHLPPPPASINEIFWRGQN